MCRVDVHTPQLSLHVETGPAANGGGYALEANITPSADFIGCLLTGVMAALPAFLDAFMRCLAGGDGSSGYKPGNRQRCQ